MLLFEKYFLLSLAHTDQLRYTSFFLFSVKKNYSHRQTDGQIDK